MAEDDDVRRRARLDQVTARMADILPPTLARFYEGCLAVGFDKVQATQFTAVLLAGLLSNAKH